MPIRRSPVLTPRSLAARRANALKSTGPRTAAGKARSCLNALRHGRRARDVREKIARTGDTESLFLLDWLHDRILLHWRPRNERWWNYTVRLSARVWCFLNGRSLRLSAPMAKPEAGADTGKATGTRPKPAPRFYQYGDSRRCPHHLKISRKRGSGVLFVNPTPTRRRHVLTGWLPDFRLLPGPPPKPRRVRRVTVESNRGGPGPAPEMVKKEVQTKLECAQESVIYYDSPATPAGGALERAAGHPGSRSDAGSGDAQPGMTVLRPAAPPQVMFAGDEATGFDGFGDEDEDGDFEAREAAQALIEQQWARWRQSMTKACCRTA